MSDSNIVYESRRLCVLCINSNLIPFITMYNFQVKCILEDNDNDNLDNWDMKLGYCELCGSVQQMNLINPDILYKKYPLDNTHSILWNTHHVMFTKFIIDNISKNMPIIEIGSSSAILVDDLINDFEDYTIFDYSLETTRQLPYLKYIEGNCENYLFPSSSVIVMSHVFEHLYNPKQFLANCESSKVENIVISIPNMNNEELITISREHTFTYNSSDIENIFNIYGYYLNKMEIHGNNFSIFYHFNRIPTSILISRLLNTERYLITKKYFNNKYDVPPNSILISAGFYSQVLYYNILNKKNIIGVIDNDPKKQGRIFCGTNLIVNKFSFISNFTNDVSALVLKGHLWTEEIVNIIRNYNTNITIIYL